MGMIQGVHNIYTGADGAAIIHVIRDVVEMEQPVHEIAADAKLGESGVGVAPGSQEPGL